MPEQVKISTHRRTETFRYRNNVVLTATSELPVISPTKPPVVATKINVHYRALGRRFNRHAQKMAKEAEKWFLEAQKENFPFHPYESLLTYTVTFNQDCYLSLYYNWYDFTGGAHGNTVREADTWDLTTGKLCRLADFFPKKKSPEKLILPVVYAQALARQESGEDFYFDDLRKNLKKYFDPEQFYLTPEGLAVFYQQITISPYSSGFATFVLPWAELGIRPPVCPAKESFPLFWEKK